MDLIIVGRLKDCTCFMNFSVDLGIQLFIFIRAVDDKWLSTAAINDKAEFRFYAILYLHYTGDAKFSTVSFRFSPYSFWKNCWIILECREVGKVMKYWFSSVGSVKVGREQWELMVGLLTRGKRFISFVCNLFLGSYLINLLISFWLLIVKWKIT